MAKHCNNANPNVATRGTLPDDGRAIRGRVFEQVLDKLKSFPIPCCISGQLTLPGITKAAE